MDDNPMLKKVSTVFEVKAEDDQIKFIGYHKFQDVILTKEEVLCLALELIIMAKPGCHHEARP